MQARGQSSGAFPQKRCAARSPLRLTWRNGWMGWLAFDQQALWDHPAAGADPETWHCLVFAFTPIAAARVCQNCLALP